LLQIVIHGPLPPGLRDTLTNGPSDFSGGLAGIREQLLQLGGKLRVITGETKSIVEASLTLVSPQATLLV